MEIVRTPRDHYLELTVEGRLDGYWAQHLSAALDEVMREGTHAVRLNLSRLSYISSAGIGALVEIYKNFQAVNGAFAVTEPSPSVQHVLEMVGLAKLLAGAAAPGTFGPAAAAAPAREPQRIHRAGASFEIHDDRVAATITCSLIGHPERLPAAAFTAADCRAVSAKDDRLILGLGAFGDNFESCQGRFGEFLAVAGAAAGQPTDGTNHPDYMLSSGGFVPRLSVLYSLSCEGAFSKLLRFESSTGDPVPWSAIVETCLEVADAESAAIVVMAESAGIMGAALKRSPVTAESAGIFRYPEIRRWLSFSPERSHARALALIAGVASAGPPGDLAPFLRPIARRSKLAGHFHAAAFGYRPLQKGRVEMRAAVRGLFDAGGLQGVMHVLADDREIAGGGETELLRGACWVAPIARIHRQEDAL